LLYLILYPVGRFFLEFLRLDASQIAGINANQTFMAIVALLSATALVLRHRKGGSEADDDAEADLGSGTAPENIDITE